jgi:PAS domain S-box-containing protein
MRGLAETTVDMPTQTERLLRDEVERLKALLGAQEETLRVLRRSDERYRTIFENIQDVYYETNLEGVVLEVSPSILPVSGYAREQVIGTSIYQAYVDPHDRERFIDRIKSVHAVTDYELLLKNRDGAPVACAITARLVLDASGTPEKICGMMRVIEERKRFERSLAESENLYRTLVEQSPFSIARIGPDGRFVFVNQQFVSWIGVPAEAVIGHGAEVFHGLMSPQMWKVMVDAVAGSLVEGKKTECELMFSRPVGTALWVMQIAYPWRDADGHVVGAEIQGFDITKRKQADELLKASSETFSRIFNLGPLISVITRLADGRFIEVNDAFVQVTGYSREEIIGTTSPSLDMIDPAVRDRANADVVKNGYVITEADVRLKSGAKRTGLFHARLIVLGGEPCLLQTVIDITDLKRGQQALQQSNRELERRVQERTAELERSNAELALQIAERQKVEDERRIAEQQLQHMQRMESLGLLAGGIAHDFNNLLAGIFGNISLARLGTGQGEVAELLDQTLGLFGRAKALTRQLLTFSRGGHPFKKVQPLAPVLRSTVTFALSGSDVTVHFDLPDDLWPCDIDENQLGQVVENIVINARQAMAAGGSIRIAAENVSSSNALPPTIEKGPCVRVAIADTGPGIAPEHLAHVFDPFFTTKQEGSGLGLATAYSIIKKHGGLLAVESALGKGATFAFYVRAVPGRPPVAAGAIAMPAAARGNVLVMDDEPFMRAFFERGLRQIGCSVTTVADGQAAVAAYGRALGESRPFDLAILDLTVPGGMGGKATVQKLLEIDPRVKALAASGFSEDPVMADPGSAGFRGALAKPFTVEQLAAAVRGALGDGGAKG